MYILEDIVLPSNKKLKAIRKYLKVNQQKISGDKIDRSLISYIENGKTKLTKSTAEILANNLKKIIKEKNLDFKIDAEYLMADEKKQVGYQLDTCIKKMNRYLGYEQKKFPDEFEKAEKLLKQYDIPSKKAKIYELAGDYCYNKECFEESKINYMKSLENYIKISDVVNMASVNSKLGRCALRNERYEESINFNNYALSLLLSNNMNNSEIEKRVLFNNAIAYRKLKKQDEALKYLCKLIDNYEISEEDKQLDVILLEGNIYFEKGDYDKAIRNYKKFLQISEDNSDKEMISVVYRNMGEVYSRTDKKEEAIIYLKKSIEVSEIKDSIHTILTVKSIVEIYIESGEFDKAKAFIMDFLDKHRDSIGNYGKLQLYDILIDVYIMNGENEIEDYIIEDYIIEDLVDIVISKGKKDGIERVILKLCSFYFDRDTEKVKKLLNLGLIVK